MQKSLLKIALSLLAVSATMGPASSEVLKNTYRALWLSQTYGNDHTMVKYVNKVGARIEEMWRPPGGDAATAHAATVRLVVRADGSLVKATVRESSGVKSIDLAAITAAKSAAPFDPIPCDRKIPLVVDYVFNTELNASHDFGMAMELPQAVDVELVSPTSELAGWERPFGERLQKSLCDSWHSVESSTGHQTIVRAKITNNKGAESVVWRSSGCAKFDAEVLDIVKSIPSERLPDTAPDWIMTYLTFSTTGDKPPSAQAVPPSAQAVPTQAKIAIEDTIVACLVKDERLLSASQKQEIEEAVQSWQRAVEANWKPSKPSQNQRTNIGLQLNEDGAFTSANVLKPSNDKVMDQAALSAVKTAALRPCKLLSRRFLLFSFYEQADPNKQPQFSIGSQTPRVSVLLKQYEHLECKAAVLDATP